MQNASRQSAGNVRQNRKDKINMDIIKSFSLEGEISLVTGASYGIGFAIARAYAQAGAKIIFNDLNEKLADKGIAVRGYVCDVTKEEQVNEMVAQIEKHEGIIDILVNNAGIIKRIPMCDMTAEEFRQVIDVDLNAPFIVSKAVIPGIRCIKLRKRPYSLC